MKRKLPRADRPPTGEALTEKVCKDHSDFVLYGAFDEAYERTLDQAYLDSIFPPKLYDRLHLRERAEAAFLAGAVVVNAVVGTAMYANIVSQGFTSLYV